MKRSLVLVLVLLAIGLPSTGSAAPRSGSRLCVVVLGAPEDVSPGELTQGVQDGSHTVTSVRPCALSPRGGRHQRADRMRLVTASRYPRTDLTQSR
jgi:hypothetical protein